MVLVALHRFQGANAGAEPAAAPCGAQRAAAEKPFRGGKGEDSRERRANRAYGRGGCRALFDEAGKGVQDLA